jgi:hypothetical protein
MKAKERDLFERLWRVEHDPAYSACIFNSISISSPIFSELYQNKASCTYLIPARNRETKVRDALLAIIPTPMVINFPLGAMKRGVMLGSTVIGRVSDVKRVIKRLRKKGDGGGGGGDLNSLENSIQPLNAILLALVLLVFYYCYSLFLSPCDGCENSRTKDSKV